MSSPIRLDLEIALQDLLVAIEDLPKQARSVRDVVTLETTARSLLHALNVAERATVDHPPYLGS